MSMTNISRLFLTKRQFPVLFFISSTCFVRSFSSQTSYLSRHICLNVRNSLGTLFLLRSLHTDPKVIFYTRVHIIYGLAVLSTCRLVNSRKVDQIDLTITITLLIQDKLSPYLVAQASFKKCCFSNRKLIRPVTMFLLQAKVAYFENNHWFWRHRFI